MVMSLTLVRALKLDKKEVEDNATEDRQTREHIAFSVVDHEIRLDCLASCFGGGLCASLHQWYVLIWMILEEIFQNSTFLGNQTGAIM